MKQGVSLKEFQAKQMRSVLSLVRPLTDEAWEQFRLGLAIQVLEKNEYFLEAGEISNKLAFICSGLLRMYYITRDGQEFNRSFGSENHFYGAYRSAFLKEPAQFFIQALEHSELIVFDYLSMIEDPAFRDYDYFFLQQLLLIKEKREAQFLLQTPEQRYKSFLMDHPGLSNRLSDRHIASYLGITPVSLSRIKKR